MNDTFKTIRSALFPDRAIRHCHYQLIHISNLAITKKKTIFVRKLLPIKRNTKSITPPVSRSSKWNRSCHSNAVVMEKTNFVVTNAVENGFSFTFGRCFVNTWLIRFTSRSHKFSFSSMIIHRMKWRANIEDYEEDCFYNVLLCGLQPVGLLVCACCYHLERRCAHKRNTKSQDFNLQFRFNCRRIQYLQW